jgi:hypothetical protein
MFFLKNRQYLISLYTYIQLHYLVKEGLLNSKYTQLYNY